MHDPARDALKVILAQYGVSIMDTPRSLGTLLKQHAKAVPHDVEALLAATRHGIVQLIRDDPQHDPASLARVLVLHGGTSEAKAAWAVSAWTDALEFVAKPKPKAEPISKHVRITAVLVAAAVTGALSYLVWVR